MEQREIAVATDLLRYIAGCVGEGVPPEIVEGVADAASMWQSLAQISIPEMEQLARRLVRSGALRITVAGDQLRTQLVSIQEEAARTNVEVELVRADAPRTMMYDLYRMDVRRYQYLRQCVGLEPAPAGRPSLPDDATQHRIFGVVRDVMSESNVQSWAVADGAAYLMVYQRTGGIGLRVIWTLVQRWLSGGELD